MLRVSTLSGFSAGGDDTATLADPPYAAFFKGGVMTGPTWYSPALADCEVGDICIMIIASDGGSATYPFGWTKLPSLVTGTPIVWGSCFWKVLDAADISDTYTALTVTGTGSGAYVVYRFAAGLKVYDITADGTTSSTITYTPPFDTGWDDATNMTYLAIAVDGEALTGSLSVTNPDSDWTTRHNWAGLSERCIYVSDITVGRYDQGAFTHTYEGAASTQAGWFIGLHA